MERYRSITCLAPLMLMLMVLVSIAEAQSGGSFPSCAQDLVPCANYLNSTSPPSSCCNPLKQTVNTQLKCLCDLFYTPGLLQGFNISVDQALQLSRRCGVTSDLSNCKKGTAPAPASGAPPATTGGDKGGAFRVSFSGFSFLLLFWASMLFN
ncbi:hypothetical protein RJT34_32027 [Clitoria ternatea]|uniref:Bifunctional inhibitor/plant lipid transfer protein/seed storage helical domain-containing protein n=1 Tax=Clitoria ternatea TaxID=43366 RepID=A0AAN9EWY3_CLITE